MNALTQDYTAGLVEDLKDPHEAAAYLNAALEDDSEDVFLLALQDVMTAKGVGGQIFATETQHEKQVEMAADPHLSSVLLLLENMGLRLAVAVKTPLAA